MLNKPNQKSTAIIGAGPTGLIAAEYLAQAGFQVTIFERMPTPARKFLLAGRGGLNLTHSEPLPDFLKRYTPLPPALEIAIRAFPPEALCVWATALGEETFTGSSGRIFPKSFKATPLARALLRRLNKLGVTFRFNHHWSGWNNDGFLQFDTPDGPVIKYADAALLTLGGASWPRLGTDGSWQPILSDKGIDVAPLSASNAGINTNWSDVFAAKNAGTPLKGCHFTIGETVSRAEAVITRTGLEGGGIYALSAAVRAALANGPAFLIIDFKPSITSGRLAEKLAAARSGESLSNRLRKRAGLAPVVLGLLREAGDIPTDPAGLATRLKALPLAITETSTIDRAISSAGGIAFSDLNEEFMLPRLPGTFAAGEMLDWDAPTGGYLLQACFATGRAAARGMERFLTRN